MVGRPLEVIIENQNSEENTTTSDEAKSQQNQGGGGGGGGGEKREGNMMEKMVSGELTPHSNMSRIDLDSPMKGLTPKRHATICRICLESIAMEDLKEKNALILGCKCPKDLSMVHTYCARTWFEMKGSTYCEICESDAKWLPKDIRKTIEHKKSPSLMSFHANFMRGRFNDNYEIKIIPLIFCCLLPAALCAMILVSFFYEVIKLGKVLTLVLGIIIPLGTVLHWFINPKKYTIHLLFIIFYIGSTIGLTCVPFYFINMSGKYSAAIGSIGALLITILVYIAATCIYKMISRPMISPDSPNSNTLTTAGNLTASRELSTMSGRESMDSSSISGLNA